MNPIREAVLSIARAFEGQREGSYLRIARGEEGYTFRASRQPPEDQGDFDRFKALFDAARIGEIIGGEPPPLTKRTVRNILVKLAVFRGDERPLPLENSHELNALFLDQAPRYEDFAIDKAKSSGKGFRGLCEKVYLQWLHYFTLQQPDPAPIKGMIREAEFLTSRMGDREYQIDQIVYLGENKTYKVTEVAARGGAYIAVLQNTQDETDVKVVCRGTAMRRTATEGVNSAKNDLQSELGNGGVQACWETVRDAIPEAANVKVLGKSLGGAHAQRIAILLMQQRDDLEDVSLTTVNSVGVGIAAERLFARLVNQRDRPFEQTIIRSAGDRERKGIDYIPFVGGDHTGSTVADEMKCRTRIFYIHPEEEMTLPLTELSGVSKAVKLAGSFSKAHVRQSTLEDFHYREVQENKASHLRYGNQLEGMRRFFSHRCSTSFTEFVTGEAPAQTAAAEKTAKIAGVVFLLLFAGGFVACHALQPGMIVSQNLTLPGLLMAGGMGVSLMTLAIASCRWRCSHPQTA